MTKADFNTFPYIKELQINDCFAYQNLHITVNDDDDIPFKHLILTGKNGSGKTTTLNFLYENLKRIIIGNFDLFKQLETRISHLENNKGDFKMKSRWKEEVDKWNKILPDFKGDYHFFLNKDNSDVLFSYFKAKRKAKFDKVLMPTRQSDIVDLSISLGKEIEFRKKFEQYLVNKKINLAFAQLDNNQNKIKSINDFFQTIEKVFQKIFEDDSLEFIFNQKNYQFHFNLGNQKVITFDQLSDGFDAFMSIILELFIRRDIIRTRKEDVFYNPCGFVLIDEPETHLHYKLQEQVLPILTSLFPKLQFIVATHSPAVISSIKNATIFDLDTQKVLPEWGVASSYSELMITHFGLENEYSNIADEIINTTESIVEAENLSPKEKFKQLNAFFKRNENYLSPSLRLSLEVQILKLERQLSTIQA